MSPFSLFSSPGYSHFSSLLLKLKIIICSQFLKIFPLSSCCEEYKCSAMPSQREYNCQLGLTWPSTPGYPANLQYYPDTGYPAYLHYYPDTGYMAIFLPITNYFSVKNISFHFPLIHTPVVGSFWPLFERTKRHIWPDIGQLAGYPAGYYGLIHNIQYPIGYRIWQAGWRKVC